MKKEWKKWTITAVTAALNISMAFGIMEEIVKADSDNIQTLINSVELHPDYFLEVTSDDMALELQGLDGGKIIRTILEENTNNSMDTYTKVKTLYNWLIDNVSYGVSGLSSIHAIYEAHMGVCDDYNYVFSALLRYIGLDSQLAGGYTSKVGGGYTDHTWTEVNLNGTIYIFDPQVEDAIATREGGTIGYYRFGKTYEELGEDYQKSDDYAKDTFGYTTGKWIPSTDGWWYQKEDGTYPKKEWLPIDSKWYYFDEKGYILTGWQQLKDNWYYFRPNGAMAQYCYTPDGYFVGEDGLWEIFGRIDVNQYQ